MGCPSFLVRSSSRSSRFTSQVGHSDRLFAITLLVHLAVRAERAGHILAFAVRTMTQAALFCIRALSVSWEKAINTLVGVWGAETSRAAVAVYLAASVGGADAVFADT